MLFSGFPGLSQLGLFSVVGLLVAAAATRFLLPRLIVAADLAPLPAGDPARLLRIERWRRYACRRRSPWRSSAALYLLVIGGPTLQRAWPRSARCRRRRWRSTPNSAPSLAPRTPGKSPSSKPPAPRRCWNRRKQLLPLLGELQAQGAITGAEVAARFLPSATTQLARRASLPDPDVLAARVAEAQAGLPFRPEALRPFLDDVAAARNMEPLTPADLPPGMTRRGSARCCSSATTAGSGWWFRAACATRRASPRPLQAAGALYVDMAAAPNGLVATTRGGAPLAGPRRAARGRSRCWSD